MMNLVAIDTALENCSVGLSAGGTTFSRVRTIGRGHAEILMGEIAALFNEAGIRPDALDRIAVSVGPGSFTGLRVGIAAARGLALVRHLPVVGISTLAAHAYRASLLSQDGRPILTLLPGRGGEAFGQLFSAAAEPLEAASNGAVTDFAARASAEDFAVAGAGAALLGPGFSPLHLDSAPDISTLLTLGAVLDPADHPPKPLYVKAPDAVPQAGARIARR
ncbi:tRNA threonylcarbamoyladenosine biosynthesis protein TsaB [Kaistia soli DSM 19436]|uniref:tRNA threonylcarbamoyladenosine biosynthesis protein TsaB n=1 Tax=Kaistia soli DSM 19436 TaxID=1122133 RepID=A0A1M5DDI3_9HYPH|nr:tRNA (adenosine(37)-N6)-threonylcarbamoyltransferase complex dimerization subunit type 1 TsaB [Kaistia soli]SHF64904.1 tRNA threonylcarbamoyladenosine biosynthesis protein TsaB [Kaistia soli DSM 19436]